MSSSLGRDFCRELRSRSLDVTYWLFFTPLVTGALTRLSTFAGIALIAATVPRPSLSLGLWAEIPLALVLADIAGYWSHRLRHRSWLWHFHAIHHSPTRLDALAAARMHPVDDIIDNTWVGMTLFVAGFSPATIVIVGPILFLHIALTHAKLDWDFGLIGRIFVSPVHHRTHHEIGAVGNFAGMFSFIDAAFGTYAAPSGRAHGSGEPIAESLGAHLAWPFRRLRRGEESDADSLLRHDID